MYRVWIVEDEESLRKAETKYVEKMGYLVTAFRDAESALQKLGEEAPQIAFLDLRLPGMSGEELLSQIQVRSPETVAIVVSAYSEVENVVNVVQKGAFDFIKKPFNIDEFGIKLEKAAENLNLRDEISYLKQKGESVFLNCPSAAMKKVSELVERIAETPGNTTVLIHGESGVGKEVIARQIYELTRYSSGKFVELNCSSIPESLMESELFGHTKGAFTDAHQEKKGLFELAHKGTLFLDEIGDMPHKLQAKLLKVLESKEVKRVGGLKEMKVDVRIIAATNKRLEEEVEKGSFRADLFYRLNVFPVIVPPLRERSEDILPLAGHFISCFNREFRKKVKSMSKDMEKQLMAHDWPGNVRELKNTIERAMIMAGEGELNTKIQVSSSGTGELEAHIPEGGVNLEQIMSDIEKDYIRKALEATGWNQSKAAQLLGIPREILRYRMKKYELM